MNATLIAELEKLNDKYPFRAFELETRDGRRIRVTQRFHKLWTSEEKKDGDIKIENGMIAFLRYDDLEDVIRFLPWWTDPFRGFLNHPEWTLIAEAALLAGVFLGFSFASCTHQEPRSSSTVEHKDK